MVTPVTGDQEHRHQHILYTIIVQVGVDGNEGGRY